MTSEGNNVYIDKSELLKILDTLKDNETFHVKRDEMNGAVHLARQVRFSPLTSETIAARERLEEILRQYPDAELP